MRTSLRITAIATLVAMAGPAIAAEFDGSQPLICALIKASDCAQDGNCSSGSPRDLGLPIFFEVDVDAGMVTGLTRGRRHDGEFNLTAPILKVTQQENTLALQGAQNERAWNIVISKSSGAMTATVADVEVGFVLFGACTPLGS